MGVCIGLEDLLFFRSRSLHDADLHGRQQELLVDTFRNNRRSGFLIPAARRDCRGMFRIRRGMFRSRRRRGRKHDRVVCERGTFFPLTMAARRARGRIEKIRPFFRRRWIEQSVETTVLPQTPLEMGTPLGTTPTRPRNAGCYGRGRGRVSAGRSTSVGHGDRDRVRNDGIMLIRREQLAGAERGIQVTDKTGLRLMGRVPFLESIRHTDRTVRGALLCWRSFLQSENWSGRAPRRLRVRAFSRLLRTSGGEFFCQDRRCSSS